jgi:hypothetical protein
LDSFWLSIGDLELLKNWENGFKSLGKDFE